MRYESWPSEIGDRVLDAVGHYVERVKIIMLDGSIDEAIYSSRSGIVTNRDGRRFVAWTELPDGTLSLADKELAPVPTAL